MSDTPVTQVFFHFKTRETVQLARQITQDMTIEHLYANVYSMTIPGVVSISFTASVEPQVGDYVIRISELDTYHCPADVFAAKYHV